MHAAPCELPERMAAAHIGPQVIQVLHERRVTVVYHRPGKCARN